MSSQLPKHTFLPQDLVNSVILHQILFSVSKHPCMISLCLVKFTLIHTHTSHKVINQSNRIMTKVVVCWKRFY